MLFPKSLVLIAASFLGTSIASSLDLAERSTVNGECTGAGGAPGVCISTSSCSDDGGSYISNACPGTPDDIKCCTKTSCGSGGNCRWTSQCSTGNIESNLCPGPADFKCCLPAGSSTSLPEKILAKAKTAAGTPYAFGGGSCSGPTIPSGLSTKGYDCSGLVSWAICQVTGRSLFSEGLRVTYAMYCASESTLKYKKVAFADRQAGDAVFFGPHSCDCSNYPEAVHHVGLMMGSGTKMWNALKTGTNVREDDFSGWSGDDAYCPYVIRFS